ncbi:hypothetical protein AXX12_11255 [Anaerosporomusa subterranea]|uniref:Glycerol operon regulatory protein n=1 Tax=Anaerosporomusa subterranea TaxID=1794912 RepID=A0A154BPB2_ANASB|nr:IclR family transcriptional regulator [Anaerosporomusa subterranea]KYZ75776.1 hypothetical protein AXX12_11255 [Anaerosporomusa subterranea]
MEKKCRVVKTVDNQIVQSVDRALQILTAFETSSPELSIRELSAVLNLPKSTIHRLLMTLEYQGFIEQVPTSRNYRLGLRLRVLGEKVIETRNLESEAVPILQVLMQNCGETVSVSILDGIETVIVEKLESFQAMRVTSQIGKRCPIHCSGSGKALLAFQPVHIVEQILAKAPLLRFTNYTITDPQELIDQLPEIRRRGFAVDDEEIVEDQLCISAPVRDSEGKAFAAITASGPKGRIKSKGVPQIADCVMNAANQLSRCLGWANRGT